MGYQMPAGTSQHVPIGTSHQMAAPAYPAVVVNGQYRAFPQNPHGTSTIAPIPQQPVVAASLYPQATRMVSSQPPANIRQPQRMVSEASPANRITNSHAPQRMVSEHVGSPSNRLTNSHSLTSLQKYQQQPASPAASKQRGMIVGSMS